MTCPTHDTIPSWLLVFSVHKRKDRCRCQMTIRAPDLVRSALASISPSRFVSNQRHSIPLASVHFFSNQRQDSVPLSIPDRLAVLSSKHSWSSRHAHDPEVTGSLQYLFWHPKIRNSRVQSSSTMSNELPVPDGPLPQGTPLPPPFYWPFDPPFVDQRNAAREKLRRYNNTGFSTLSTTDLELQRKQILTELFGKINPAKPPFIEPPFQCDYGFNIEVGDDCYMNFGCCILDCAKVTIGNKVMFGPNVQIYCPGHPLDPVLRNGLNGFEFGLPVKVGNDVWIGGGAILLPGVTVGDGSVVGAGAVVTKDVEPMVVVAGNPAKVVKRIQKGDWGKPKTHGNIKKGTVDT